MVFTSPIFLFAFLPVTLALSFLAPRRFRNFALLIPSLFFYLWGSGGLVAILFVSIAIDYCLGFVAYRGVVTDNPTLRRLAVGASVAVNIGLLAWFKYATWLSAELDRLGFGDSVALEVTLPIGISFFTFQSMSYTIDVSRGRCEHLRNPVDFALFVALFPQLIAGPIVRFHELRDQLRGRTVDSEKFARGVLRFSHGLAKKVIIADTIAPIVDAIFAADPAGLGAPVAALGIVAYGLQLYFDFSGYADMAIGLGLMFGFDFPENFERPFSAYSITDFWRRWHITLSNWFRDYVFIPLGGSRGSGRRVTANLMAVFLLTGTWHGANWTYVIWGSYHGVWLLIERARNTGFTTDEPSSAVLARTKTLVIVTLGWVLFRADSISHSWEYTKALLRPTNAVPSDVLLTMGSRPVITLALASTVFVLPRDWYGGKMLESATTGFDRARRAFTMTIALPVSLLLITAGVVSPFLYFQF